MKRIPPSILTAFSIVPALLFTTLAAHGQSYCIPNMVGGTVEGEYISHVTLEGIFYSGGAGGDDYVDVTQSIPHQAILERGTEYSLEVNSGNSDMDLVAAWIDFNADGILEASEKVGEQATDSTFELVTFTFTVPANATVGLTRLRIRLADTAPGMDPCEGYVWGQTVDFTANIVTASPYCIPSIVMGPMEGEYITHVTLGTIDRTSDGEAIYNDFTTPESGESTTLGTGETYDLQVTNATSTQDLIAAWIDFNGNGIFEADEKVGEEATGSTFETVTFSFTVPENAAIGNTRLRVRLADTAPGMDPCDGYYWGESEDYAVNIVDTSTYCTPAPPGGTMEGEYISYVALEGIDNPSGGSGINAYVDLTQNWAQSATLEQGEVFSIEIANGTSPGDDVAAWIDFNGNGLFGASEKLGEATISSAFDTITFSFSVPASAVEGLTRLRVRVGDALTPLFDPCLDYVWGEVEDYTVQIVQPTPYCIPVPANGTAAGDYISHVSLGSIDNPSDAGTYYDDHTDQSTDLGIGAEYTLSVTNGTSAQNGIAAWIDYDRDSVFEAGEQIGHVVTTEANAMYSIIFTVPAGTSPGTTRLRVRLADPDAPDPCANEIQGETEDYTVELLVVDCEGVPGGSALPGTACDDGDANTGNDTYDSDCNCAGETIDCEGIPGGSALPGTACDDGDANTGNDVYDSECNCAGETIDCEGIPGGSALPGTACDDGDANTGNDTYDSECNCAGETIDCEGVPGGSATVGTACDDGDPNTGNDVYDDNCNCTGVPYDCEGVPGGSATVGTACDDGDPNTGNDVYDSDCNCAGEPIDCEGVPGGSATVGTACDDGDPNTGNDTYDSNCNCVGQPYDCEGVIGGAALPGTTCDDGDTCTTGDVYDANCDCAGIFQDADGDGTCDANDLCPDGQEPGTACDDGDPVTVNDVINDSCECVGDTTVGISSTDAIQRINIHPNPSNGMFTITPGAPAESMRFTVLNALGQVVRPWTALHGRTVLDLSGLASGTYVLRWHAADTRGQRTLLVQH